MNVPDLWRRSPWWTKAILGATALAGVLIAVFMVYANTLFSERTMCGSRGNYHLDSPDGKYRAVLYEYDCGATTDFGTRLAVESARRKFDPYDVKRDELVFLGAGDHGAVGVDRLGILPISARWMDSSHLDVTFPAGTRISIQEPQSGPVSVGYHVAPAGEPTK